MMQLEGLSKSFGSRELFAQLQWTVSPGERVGLVGPNGAGKSTLMKIIAGIETSDTGRIVMPSSFRVGYLPQELHVTSKHSVLDEVLEGRQDVLDMEQKLEELGEVMGRESDPSRLETLSDRYVRLQTAYEVAGGSRLRPRAHSILSGMGFGQDAFQKPLDTFSGGWQMRAVLSRLLLEEPDILLMDEPTNHLDLPSVEWLEGFLKGYAGSVILISHDRYFLNRMVTQIASIEAGSLKVYTGNYDAFLEQRERDHEMLAKSAEQQKKKIAKLERFVERFGAKATKAKQAQSRLKQLEKIERIEVPGQSSKTMHFSFSSCVRSGRMVVEVEGARKAYGDNVVYDQVDFRIERGERVALVGPNGAGKTTLLKMIAGTVGVDAGSVELGHQVEMQYFAQHQVKALELSNTVLAEMERDAPMEAIPKVRGTLGAFLFSGDDVQKRVSALSGGEKNRLAMAKMLLQPSNFLLLDEPTNHLDIASRDVLESAMLSFDGTVCFVSHDRHFIDAVATRVVHVEGGGLREYLGNYAYYEWKRRQEEEEARLAQDASSSDAAGKPSTSKQLSRKDAKRERSRIRDLKRAEMGTLQRDLETTEATIAKLEREQESIQAEMAKPELYEDGQRVETLSIRLSTIESELESLYVSWEELGARVEIIETKYAEMEAEALGE